MEIPARGFLDLIDTGALVCIICTIEVGWILCYFVCAREGFTVLATFLSVKHIMAIAQHRFDVLQLVFIIVKYLSVAVFILANLRNVPAPVLHFAIVEHALRELFGCLVLPAGIVDSGHDHDIVLLEGMLSILLHFVSHHLVDIFA